MKQIIKNHSPNWLFQILVRLAGLSKGKWPLFISKKSLVKASNTNTLTGKILRKMAFDRNPLLPVFADKFLVRDYVSAKIGPRYLPKLISSGDSFKILNLSSFPSNFALKTNNASGAVILVWDMAPAQNKLPKYTSKDGWRQHLIQPHEFVHHTAERLVNRWLTSSYYYRPGRFPEWAYKGINSTILVEELMFDEHGNLPIDYKFFMANGTCIFIQVDTKRFTDHRTDFYSSDWERIQGRYEIYPNSEIQMDKPKHLDEMLAVAKTLSSEVDFVRVDLFQTNSGVKFGELTNYPGGGLEKFSPSILDSVFGEKWSQNY